MGTNYYWYGPKPDTCPTCGHPPNRQRLHIGKSSYGWAFALHVGPMGTGSIGVPMAINGLDDWLEIWRSGGHIEDEYGRELSTSEMLEVIMERRPGKLLAGEDRGRETNRAIPAVEPRRMGRRARPPATQLPR